MKVTLNLPTYLDLCGAKVRLKPGVNDVDPKVWAVVQDHPITHHYISARAIEVEKPARGQGSRSSGRWNKDSTDGEGSDQAAEES